MTRTELAKITSRRPVDNVAYDARPPAVAPDSKLLSPRNGSRGLLPSTWLERTLKIEYTDASGKACSAAGVLLDWCPVGVILSLGGAKTLLPWERLCLLELEEG